MEIELLHVPECPNRTLARDRVDRALAQARLAARVHEREVQTGDEAVRLGMRGSPTILIDGVDPFAATAGPPSLSCRLYRAEGGKASGAPSVKQLIEALAG